MTHNFFYQYLWLFTLPQDDLVSLTFSIKAETLVIFLQAFVSGFRKKSPIAKLAREVLILEFMIYMQSMKNVIHSAL